VAEAGIGPPGWRRVVRVLDKQPVQPVGYREFADSEAVYPDAVHRTLALSAFGTAHLELARRYLDRFGFL
jgi:hypothetical protein